MSKDEKNKPDEKNSKEITIRWASADDPIYTRGLLIGFQRVGDLLKNTPKNSETEEETLEELA